MDTTTIKIGKEQHRILSRLAREEGVTMVKLLAQAVDLLRREKYLGRLNEDYARLRANGEAWDEFQREMAAWETTSADGLEQFPYDSGEEDEDRGPVVAAETPPPPDTRTGRGVARKARSRRRA